MDRFNGRLVIPACMAMLGAALLSIRLVQSPLTALLDGIVLGAAAAAMAASEGTLVAVILPAAVAVLALFAPRPTETFA